MSDPVLRAQISDLPQSTSEEVYPTMRILCFVLLCIFVHMWVCVCLCVVWGREMKVGKDWKLGYKIWWSPRGSFQKINSWADLCGTVGFALVFFFYFFAWPRMVLAGFPSLSSWFETGFSNWITNSIELVYLFPEGFISLCPTFSFCFGSSFPPTL